MLRVIKVGGSLLDWPELLNALPHWLHQQSDGASVLICGGGKWVDRIRGWWRRGEVNDAAADQMATDQMCGNVWLIARILGNIPIVTEYNELLTKLRRRRRRQLLVFDARKLLGEREATLNARRLPRDWTVTSDSIAAWLAELLDADELVLLKSADPPASDFLALASAGYVDAFFPQAAQRIPAVRFVNLRSYVI